MIILYASQTVSTVGYNRYCKRALGYVLVTYVSRGDVPRLACMSFTVGDRDSGNVSTLPVCTNIWRR